MMRLFIFLALCVTCVTSSAQRFVKVVDTVNSLVAANPFDVHTNAFVVGLTNISIYTWSAASTEPTNANLSVLKANNVSTGRWFLHPSGGGAGVTNIFDIIYVTNLFAGDTYVSNLFVTNFTALTTNTFITNFFFNETYITNINQGFGDSLWTNSATDPGAIQPEPDANVFVPGEVHVGQPGETGLIEMASTNGTYIVTLTVDEDGSFILNYGTTNMLTILNGSSAANDGSPTKVFTAAGYFTNVSAISGGGGNVFNTGGSAASNIPRYTDTTGTNIAPSTALIDAAGQLSTTNAWMFANGNAVATAGSTNTFTNKTLDYSGTGNILNLRRSIKLQIPRFTDGSGCMATNTNYVALDNFMVPIFSGSADTNANYCFWLVRVPKDFNASGADVTASLSVTLGGTDADAANFTLGMVSIANGSPVLSATPANFNAITVTPTSAAAGDGESSDDNTLTGWKAAMTANQFWKIQLQRVDNSNDDSIAMQELEIFYDATQ